MRRILEVTGYLFGGLAIGLLVLATFAAPPNLFASEADCPGLGCMMMQVPPCSMCSNGCVGCVPCPAGACNALPNCNCKCRQKSPNCIMCSCT